MIPSPRRTDWGRIYAAVSNGPLIPMWFSRDRATLIVDLGLKSAGLVPGEPLGAGFITRAGVGLPLAR